MVYILSQILYDKTIDVGKQSYLLIKDIKQGGECRIAAMNITESENPLHIFSFSTPKAALDSVLARVLSCLPWLHFPTKSNNHRKIYHSIFDTPKRILIVPSPD